jgi:phthiocerol/phenolphthiocerol synthesis type-I polyketide synthase E
LQSAGLDGRTGIDPRFETIASNYLKEIRALQPHGPYYIGGYCLGGVIALEIAQQLIAQGERVAFLAMIENFNVKVIQWPMPFYLRYYNHILNIAYHVGNLVSIRNTDKMSFIKAKVKVEISRFNVLLNVAWSQFLIRIGFKISLKYHHKSITKLYDDALKDYNPKPFPGKIHLFVAHKRLAGFNDQQWGWGSVAREGVVIHEMLVYPRGSLVVPYVKKLAKLLQETIDMVRLA